MLIAAVMEWEDAERAAEAVCSCEEEGESDGG